MPAAMDVGTVTVEMVNGRNLTVPKVQWSTYERIEASLGDKTQDVIGITSLDGSTRRSFPRAKVLFMEWNRTAGG